MNTREIAAEYRLSHWAEIMRERQESGMSIKSFCKSAGFHEHVYYYWQRKLREAACMQLARQDNGLSPSGWARLEPAAIAPSTQGLTIEIGGCRVNVTAETDSKLLAEVCRTLKSLYDGLRR